MLSGEIELGASSKLFYCIRIECLLGSLSSSLVSRSLLRLRVLNGTGNLEFVADDKEG
jgi:hypothetical protein